MNTTTTVNKTLIGLALFVAAKHAKDPMRSPTLDNCMPLIHSEILEDYPRIKDLIDGVEDESEFDSTEFLETVDRFFKLAKEGKLKFVATYEEHYWTVYEDHDRDMGCLVGVAEMVRFHQAVNAAKHPVIWCEGPLLAVVDCDPALIG